MQIALNGNGIPVISYTTPGATNRVTTASRNAPLPGGSICAVSRKMHGSGAAALPFDVNLPLAGNPAVECRSGGTAGDYQVIVNFPGAVTVGSASISGGSGTAALAGVQHSTVTVNLTGVTMPQVTTVRLANVNNGVSVSDVTIPLAVLVGDVNGDRSVNAGDTLQTRSRSGQTTNVDNFRADVNVDGSINSGDATIVRGRSGQSITGAADEADSARID
jgi:hypothetical protein